MKTNLDFYPHRKDSHRHPKFKALRAIYGGGSEGWAAEGRFWALNNIIADSEFCQLDLNKKRNRAVVAEEIGISLEDLDQFIDILAGEDVELLTEIEPLIYVTNKVQEVLTTAQKQREKARTRKLLQSSHEPDDPLQDSLPEPNNRREEKKVKETKEEESKGNKIPSTPEDVDNFFLKHKHSKEEGRKFFNYYKARDWTINGTKIIDWEHAAKGWIDRIPQFNNRNNNHSAGNLPDSCTYGELLKLHNEGNKAVWDLYEKDPSDPKKKLWRLKNFEKLPVD